MNTYFEYLYIRINQKSEKTLLATHPLFKADNLLRKKLSILKKQKWKLLVVEVGLGVVDGEALKIRIVAI